MAPFRGLRDVNFGLAHVVDPVLEWVGTPEQVKKWRPLLDSFRAIPCYVRAYKPKWRMVSFRGNFCKVVTVHVWC